MDIAIKFSLGLLALCACATSTPAQAARVLYAYDEPGQSSLVAITDGYIEDRQAVSPVFCSLGEYRCTAAWLYQGNNPTFAGLSMEAYRPGGYTAMSIPFLGASLTRPGTYTNPLSDARLVVIGPVAAAVPEPETWTLLICGFGLVGGAMRATRHDSGRNRRRGPGNKQLTA